MVRLPNSTSALRRAPFHTTAAAAAALQSAAAHRAKPAASGLLPVIYSVGAAGLVIFYVKTQLHGNRESMDRIFHQKEEVSGVGLDEKNRQIKAEVDASQRASLFNILGW